MADPPDLDALARRYLDYWEEQAAAIAADPAVADLVARLFGAFGAFAGAAEAKGGFAGGPAAFTSGHERSNTASGDDGQPDEAQPGGSAPNGAAAARAASVAGDDRLDELLRRVARLEERLDALEAAGRKAGSGARGKSRRG